jgi:predicted nuclease of restriction endonuclease-like (RecB) superfamily
MTKAPALPADYRDLLAALKARIGDARLRASVSVNRELVLLYWEIGRDILARQAAEGWGTGVIERLARDLKRDFSDMTGLSPRNLKYMQAFAEAWPDREIVQQLVAQLPWGHNLRLLEAVKRPEERTWYARQAVEHGWSRAVLAHQIESRLFERTGKAPTNFSKTLPAPQSDLARELLKDPYDFEFLAVAGDISERELERGLLDDLRALLLELGMGFALVGSQSHLAVGDQDFYLNLPFYSLRRRCFVVIDLKVDEARVRRQDEVLPVGRRRPAAPPCGRAFHRSDPLPGQERGDRRIRAAGRRKANGRGRLPGLVSASGAA